MKNISVGKSIIYLFIFLVAVLTILGFLIAILIRLIYLQNDVYTILQNTQTTTPIEINSSTVTYPLQNFTTHRISSRDVSNLSTSVLTSTSLIQTQTSSNLTNLTSTTTTTTATTTTASINSTMISSNNTLNSSIPTIISTTTTPIFNSNQSSTQTQTIIQSTVTQQIIPSNSSYNRYSFAFFSKYPYEYLGQNLATQFPYVAEQYKK